MEASRNLVFGSFFQDGKLRGEALRTKNMKTLITIDKWQILNYKKTARNIQK